jgi:hypothetical protein
MEVKVHVSIANLDMSRQASAIQAGQLLQAFVAHWYPHLSMFHVKTGGKASYKVMTEFSI